MKKVLFPVILSALILSSQAMAFTEVIEEPIISTSTMAEEAETSSMNTTRMTEESENNSQTINDEEEDQPKQITPPKTNYNSGVKHITNNNAVITSTATNAATLAVINSNSDKTQIKNNQETNYDPGFILWPFVIGMCIIIAAVLS